MNTNKKTARIAGFLYLSFIVFSAIANVVGRKGIIIDGDAAATAANIIAQGMLFRIGFVSDLLSALLFLLTAWALYALLKQVNRTLALREIVREVKSICAGVLGAPPADYDVIFTSSTTEAINLAAESLGPHIRTGHPTGRGQHHPGTQLKRTALAQAARRFPHPLAGRR